MVSVNEQEEAFRADEYVSETYGLQDLADEIW